MMKKCDFNPWKDKMI